MFLQKFYESSFLNLVFEFHLAFCCTNLKSIDVGIIKC